MKLPNITREIVSQDFLLKHLNDNLKQQPGCENCYFPGVQPLGEEDAEGCNWSADWLRTGGADKEDRIAGFNAVISAARLKYNLE